MWIFFIHLKATRTTWTEPVKSKQLKEQFNSFEVKIDNYHDCHFLRNIFAEDFITELETEIKTLAQGVYLVKDIQRTDCLQPMDTVVHEVEVTVMEKNLCVGEPVIIVWFNIFWLFWYQLWCINPKKEKMKLLRIYFFLINIDFYRINYTYVLWML